MEAEASPHIFRCGTNQWGITLNGSTHIGYANALAALNALEKLAEAEPPAAAAPRPKKASSTLQPAAPRTPIVPPEWQLTMKAAKEMIDKTLRKTSARSALGNGADASSSSSPLLSSSSSSSSSGGGSSISGGSSNRGDRAAASNVVGARKRTMSKAAYTDQRGRRCCEVLEQEGGMFGCERPFGHDGPHFEDVPARKEEKPAAAKRARASEPFDGAAAAPITCDRCGKVCLNRAGLSSHLRGCTGEQPAEDAVQICQPCPTPAEETEERTCQACGKVCANLQGLRSHQRGCAGTMDVDGSDDGSGVGDAETAAASGKCEACQGKHRAHTCLAKRARFANSSSSSSSSSSTSSSSGRSSGTAATVKAAPPPARKPMVVQEAEAEEEAEDEDDDDEAASGVKKSRRSTAGKGVPRLGWNDGWAKGAAGAWRSIEKQSAKALALHAKSLLTPRALVTMPEGERESARIAIERESRRLRSLSYAEILLDKAEWLKQMPIHPRGKQWGDGWSARVSKALKDMPVRRSYTLNGTHTTNFGRVAGCSDFLFEVLYEDGFHEAISYGELKPLLVLSPQKEDELEAIEDETPDDLTRVSRRAAKPRDVAAEAEAYLPRLGCHMSLPPGKIACHIHEAMRASGLVRSDPGPLASD